MKIRFAPTYKQHKAWEALATNDAVFMGGGAGGGKSWLICETRLANCYQYPGYRSFIAREELKRLMNSTFITWTKVCKYHNISKADWRLHGDYNYIEFYNGSRIDLLDVKYMPSDPLYERFGSVEYTDGAIEETGEVHFMAYDVLKTRINRHLNDKYNINASLLLTGNPKKNWTYNLFYLPYKNGKLPDNYSFVQALYGDNKFAESAYKKQLDGIRDPVTKQRLMYGIWEYDEDPSCLLDIDDINNLFSNDYIERGQKYIIADVARYGSDKAIITVWDGLRLIERASLSWSSTVDVENVINALRVKHSVQMSNILVDEDGIGGGVVDHLGCEGFVNNSRPVDEAYYNLKSECGYKLAEKIKEIYIECDLSQSEIDDIRQELTMLKTFEADRDKKLRILPKEKIKDVIGRSPDWLDVFIMRMKYLIEKPFIPPVWHTR